MSRESKGVSLHINDAFAFLTEETSEDPEHPDIGNVNQMPTHGQCNQMDSDEKVDDVGSSDNIYDMKVPMSMMDTTTDDLISSSTRHDDVQCLDESTNSQVCLNQQIERESNPQTIDSSVAKDEAIYPSLNKDSEKELISEDTSKCVRDPTYSVDSGVELGIGDTQTIDDENHVVVRRRIKLPSVTSTNDDGDNGDDDDEDIGVYDESVRRSVWRFVKEEDTESTVEEEEELEQEQDKNDETMARSDSVSTTHSEAEFRYRRTYQEISTRKVQRKSSLQTFARANSYEITAEKTVTLTKMDKGQGLGFHIIGSHPTVVSTVVSGSVAERAGIEIGDVILAVNYESVLRLNHEDIVKLLTDSKSKSDILTIEFCKETSFSVMNSERMDPVGEVYSTYVYKQTSSTFNIWKKRWLVLKSDNCLYYYKTKEDKEILGAIPLSGYTLRKATDNKRSRDHAFKLMHYTKNYYFAAMNESDLSKWASLLNKATSEQSTMDNWIDVSAHNVGLPALSISNVDCSGYLYKMGGHYKSWKKRYCVLKDGCLFYYCDVNSRSAQGVAHLHGYVTNANPSTNKRNAFDLVPPESKMRTFHFCTETELDKERWLRAMKLSIGRWVQVT